MVSNAGGGGEVAGIGDMPATATATGGDTCACSSPAAVAAGPHPCQQRRQLRRLPAMASVTAGAAMWHDTVKI
jgi:hypothetical protein